MIIIIRQKYGLYDNSEEYEPRIRSFLLNTANILRLTNIVPKRKFKLFNLELALGSRSNPNDKHTIEVLKSLNPWLIKEDTNNVRFNNIPQATKDLFIHYYYELSPQLKQMINDGTLLWKLGGSFFDGVFEDPAFYLDTEMLCHIITHESYIFLNLTSSEKNKYFSDIKFFTDTDFE